MNDHDWYIMQYEYFSKLKEIYCYDQKELCDKTLEFGKAFFFFYKLNKKLPTFDEFVDYLKYKGII